MFFIQKKTCANFSAFALCFQILLVGVRQQWTCHRLMTQEGVQLDHVGRKLEPCCYGHVVRYKHSKLLPTYVVEDAKAKENEAIIPLLSLHGWLQGRIWFGLDSECTSAELFSRLFKSPTWAQNVTIKRKVQ